MNKKYLIEWTVYDGYPSKNRKNSTPIDINDILIELESRQEEKDIASLIEEIIINRVEEDFHVKVSLDIRTNLDMITEQIKKMVNKG